MSIIKVNEEGISELKLLSSSITSAADGLSDDSANLMASIDNYADDLGPHIDSISDAIEGIRVALEQAIDPIEGVSSKLNDLAGKYEAVVNNNRFNNIAGAAGSSGFSSGGSSGGGVASSSSAVSNNSSASSRGVSKEVKNTTDSLVSENEFSHDEKVKWITSNVGCSESEAADIVGSMEYYSMNGYKTIHGDKNADLQHTKNILKVFDSKNVPRYSGVTHRGLSFGSKEELLGVLQNSKGIWNEPGITSFSTDRSIADGFASNKQYGLVLTVKNGSAGIPFSHMSQLAYEHEVLYPGSLRGVSWQLVKDSARYDPNKRIMYIDVIERS